MNRPPDELEHRIDAALRRRFATPAGLDDLAVRLRPHPRPASRLGAWLALAAAAAAVVVLVSTLWPAKRGAGATPVHRQVAARPHAREPVAEQGFRTCRLLSAPVGAPRASSVVQNPDLVRLYRDMDACQRGASADECEDDQLQAEQLSALELRPGAAELAHGPFLSDEWPTGQILTMTIDDQTVAVVVERRSTLDCCVHPRLDEASGLQCFTWARGDLVLAEITPLDEPRMIPYLE